LPKETAGSDIFIHQQWKWYTENWTPSKKSDHLW